MESAGDPAQLSIGNLPARQECFDFSPDPGFRVWGFGFVVLGSGFWVYRDTPKHCGH